MSQMRRKKNYTGLVANIPNVIFFFFFRFGITSLYTVVFGRFPRPKKCHFWIFGTFWKVTIFFRHSILIICHFGHFSFSTLFLNVARYTLSAISGTRINMRFIFIFILLFFLKLFLKNKNGQHSSCWQRPRKHCFFLKLFPKPHSFGRFPLQKWNFQGPKFWSKMPKKQVIFQTNFFFHFSPSSSHH